MPEPHQAHTSSKPLPSASLTFSMNSSSGTAGTGSWGGRVSVAADGLATYPCLLPEPRSPPRQKRRLGRFLLLPSVVLAERFLDPVQRPLGAGVGLRVADRPHEPVGARPLNEQVVGEPQHGGLGVAQPLGDRDERAPRAGVG